MKIDKTILGVAAEFAVAAELCRRNIYAQPTFANLKRVDLLVLTLAGRTARVEVKAKQGRDWPNCKGISGDGVFLVFVDFAGKPTLERPDFYVLDATDWREVAENDARRCRTKHPDRRAEVSPTGVLTLPNEVNKAGKPHTGCGVRVEHIVAHKEAWAKVASHLGVELDGG